MAAIINVSKLVELMDNGNHYSYTRVKNLLRGFRGNSTKEDVQHLRKVLKEEHRSVDIVLAKIENEIKPVKK